MQKVQNTEGLHREFRNFPSIKKKKKKHSLAPPGKSVVPFDGQRNEFCFFNNFKSLQPITSHSSMGIPASPALQ
jgi:hypothetical protein